MVVRTLTYLLSLGGDGLREASTQAVLSANYMRVKLKESYPAFFDRLCMHEFTATMAPLKKETGVSAADLAKSMLDGGMHPPTMYFPLNVPEALMFEPTETESILTLDKAIAFLDGLVQKAYSDPEALHQAPVTTRISRVDEVQAARKPITRYIFPDEASL